MTELPQSGTLRHEKRDRRALEAPDGPSPRNRIDPGDDGCCAFYQRARSLPPTGTEIARSLMPKKSARQETPFNRKAQALLAGLSPRRMAGVVDLLVIFARVGRRSRRQFYTAGQWREHVAFNRRLARKYAAEERKHRLELAADAEKFRLEQRADRAAKRKATASPLRKICRRIGGAR